MPVTPATPLARAPVVKAKANLKLALARARAKRLQKFEDERYGARLGRACADTPTTLRPYVLLPPRCCPSLTSFPTHSRRDTSTATNWNSS